GAGAALVPAQDIRGGDARSGGPSAGSVWARGAARGGGPATAGCRTSGGRRDRVAAWGDFQRAGEGRLVQRGAALRRIDRRLAGGRIGAAESSHGGESTDVAGAAHGGGRGVREIPEALQRRDGTNAGEADSGDSVCPLPGPL